jgi:molecular chaperone Hsp33
MNGVTALRDTKLSLNLALYLAESEQKPAVLLTDVRVDGNLCRSALGLMVERLPGATDENIERSIKNLEEVEKRGLYSYLTRSDIARTNDDSEKMFRDFEPCLQKILDDCLEGMGEGIRWSKMPTFKCSCGVERVWRALALLPKAEIKDILDTQGRVEMKCDFCAQNYVLSKEEVTQELLNQ